MSARHVKLHSLKLTSMVLLRAAGLLSLSEHLLNFLYHQKLAVIMRNMVSNESQCQQNARETVDRSDRPNKPNSRKDMWLIVTAHSSSGDVFSNLHRYPAR